MFDISYTQLAEEDIARLRRDEPSAHKKLVKLIGELMDHPRTGTGKPKQLSGDRAGQWRRKITNKHRLVYEIHDMEVVVLVLSTWGHYDDK